MNKFDHQVAFAGPKEAYDYFRMGAIRQDIARRVRDRTATGEHMQARAAIKRPRAKNARQFARQAGAA
jgi:hypothetical protein